MSTDRELLEAAAKSAGFVYLYPMGIESSPYFNEYTEWNPLDDDGDALRLAVRLGLRITINHDAGASRAECGLYDSGKFGMISEDHSDSAPSRATRRAIVLAAAAMVAG